MRRDKDTSTRFGLATGRLTFKGKINFLLVQRS